MASIINREDGSREIRFFYPKLERHTLRLGKCPKGVANTLKYRIEQLVHYRGGGSSFPLELTEWTNTLEESVRHRLVGFGLLDAKEPEPEAEPDPEPVYTVVGWINEYIDGKRDSRKPGTVTSLEQVKAMIARHFGDKVLESVSAYDAERFVDWMGTSGGKGGRRLAHNTVRRRTGRIKQFFGAAVKAKLIDSNPFDGHAAATDANEQRQFFVEQEWADKCIEEASGVDWRTIIALSRYGGLRCPSEVLGLRWEDVNLPGGEMVIRSSKTEHHRGRGVRICPIFAELDPYLQAAWDAIPDGSNAEWVVAGYRGAETNLRTSFEKIITRAGLVPWPRLFQNMRASRETELLDSFPLQDVVRWLGNSRPTAIKHYAMSRKSSFERAKREGERTSMRTTQDDSAATSDPQSRAGAGA